MNIDLIQTLEDSNEEPQGIKKPYPKDGEPVLALYRGEWRIGAIYWEHPTWEDTYQSFPYWDDPHNDGQCWEWQDVSDWLPLPPIP